MQFRKTYMKYRLMDLLACPICKTFPLRLFVFSVRNIKPTTSIRKCELYCAYHGDFIKNLSETECATCYGKEISDGLLECANCGRWYPIEEDIPRMLPDDLRNRQQDEAFLIKWKNRIPQHILNEGKPFSLLHEHT